MTRFSRLLIFPVVLFLTSAVFAQTADLALSPQGQDLSDRFVVGFALVNHGPDVARNTVLTFDVPQGVTVERISYGAGNTSKTCEPGSQRPIRCEVGDVHVLLPFHYGAITFKKGIEDASYTMSMTVSADTRDPKPSNNSHTESWSTAVEADLGILIISNTDRVDPGGDASFLANICNNVRDNRTPTVRAEFTVTNGWIVGIEPATGFTCRIEGGGATAVCTLAELHECPRDPFRIVARASTDRRGAQMTLDGRVSSDVPERNLSDNGTSTVVPVYQLIEVTTTADDGPGSLRQAINDANASCTPGPCRIVFEIPPPVPAEGWFTITPSSPLPSILADRVTLEGKHQTAFTGNTNQRGPEIAIDGRFARRGLRMLARCEGVVDGLTLGNFDEDQALWISTAGCGNRPDRREVLDSYIGVNPAATEPWPNLRGIRADFAERLTVSRNIISHNHRSGFWMWRGSATIENNLIEQNGASGIYLGPEVFSANVRGNVIRNHPEMGIAINRNAEDVQIRSNRMRANGGLGIDWGLDGVSPTEGHDPHKQSNAPVLLSARYAAATNTTLVTLTVKSSPLGPQINHGTFEFFANETPDGDGESHIGSGIGDGIGDTTTTVSIAGDYRGKWINATWTREHWTALRGPGQPKSDSHNNNDYGGMTSELSNTVLVQ